VCLDEPPSLSSQTMLIQAPPAPMRCVSEQGFSFPTPMCAVTPTRGRETQTSLCAAAVGTGRNRESGRRPAGGHSSQRIIPLPRVGADRLMDRRRNHHA